ncbi:hypothetical protein PV797_03705 [Clostridiaceae bacterium M8S5]|nr:hypothetical protein PV797_03705 [Clostridiaceae bacterium M8S5]
MFFSLINLKQDIDISSLTEKIDFLNEKITMVDSNVKFHFTIYWSIIILVITLLGIVNLVVIKKHLERKAESYIASRIDEILAKVSQFRTMYGKKYLHDAELKDGWYRFVIGGKDLNISFRDKNNNIDIKTIYGDDNLRYNARVKSGVLWIKIKDFDMRIHKGIKWRITYVKRVIDY